MWMETLLFCDRAIFVASVLTFFGHMWPERWLLNPQVNTSCFDVTEQSNLLNLDHKQIFFLPVDVSLIACTVCLVFASAVCAAALLTPRRTSLAAGPPPVRARPWTHSADCLLRYGTCPRLGQL